ncbi:MAG: hypothetical protein FJX56_11995, partial [Alphaproteobacteria bacterium]|nr:hypothetical protein [Alphaproteobacteria bacterium]
SGGLAEYGDAALTGVQLAVREINAQGGVLGGRLRLVIEDSGTTPGQAVRGARRLFASARAVGIVGELSSTVTARVLTDVIATARIPLISPAASDVALTRQAHDGFFFRTTPNDSAIGRALGSLAAARGIDRVALAVHDTAYGRVLADAFRLAYEARGGRVTNTALLAEGRGVPDDFLMRLNDGAGALAVLVPPTEGSAIVRQSTAFVERFLLADGFRSADLIAALGGPVLDGSLGVAAGTPPDAEPARRFVQAYRAAYGHPPALPYVDAAYDATFILALAIEKAGRTYGRAVRDTVRLVATVPGVRVMPGEWGTAAAAIARGRDVNYEGAAGPAEFDRFGDVAAGLVGWEVDNGRPVITALPPDAP